MGPIDAFWHLLNLFLPALGLAALAAGGTRLLWRQATRSVGWWRLAWPTAAAGAAVTLAGLLVFGHDGRMTTYGAMVLACALTLWWRAFGRRR